MQAPAVTVTQPAGASGSTIVVWMPAPGPMEGCPPGLEYLAQLDELLVHQEVQVLELLTDWECANKFSVMNSAEQQVYYALEESDICERMCCGPSRGFVYHITDNLQQDVLRVRREFRYCTGDWRCPCDSCRYFATVEDRNGQVLGYISNLQFCCKPLFGIFDPQRNLIAEIRGPCCPCQNICYTNDIDFIVCDVKDDSVMGMISKQWPGLLKDVFTHADNFRVCFPINMEVKKKALMLGAIFILDIMMYENKKKE